MKLLGLEITRKDGFLSIAKSQSLESIASTSWWSRWGLISEPYAGAWQQNVVTIDPQTSILAFSAVFACVTGIAGDIAKMRIKLMEESSDQPGIWEEMTAIHGNSPARRYRKVLRKPNEYQTRIKFIEQWIVSKLLYGNAYILKERDSERNVTALYVLHPQRVTVKIAEDGSVWYELKRDPLSGVEKESITIPASEIIHDMMVSLWHPLVGVSPIYACGVSTTMGNRIQANSTSFFGNLSRPSGMLSAPGTITQETAARLAAAWQANYSGTNLGKVAVAGDGLKYEPFTMPATDAQLIEQLKWTVEDVARAFHYPVWKLNGQLPPYASGPEALTMMYYTDCLHSIIESIELSLDEGLSLPEGIGTELDLENLWRMDTATLFDSNNKAVGGGWMSPDEARFRANMKKVTGGKSPMIQQQNFSLEALAKRDAKEDPFAKEPTTAVPPAPEPSAKDLDDLEFQLTFEAELRKEVAIK